MSIQYDLYDTPDIQQTGDAQPLHPRVVFKGTVDQEEFLDRVHKFTGISRSLLAGVFPKRVERPDCQRMDCGTGRYRIFFSVFEGTSCNEEKRCTRTIHRTEECQFPGK